MSLVVQGIPASIVNLIQERTLERMFHDALFPRLLYRGEAVPELWQANLGERQVFTRTGLMEPQLNALEPGKDPNAGSFTTEQWEAEASQLGGRIDTHMPTSYVALAPTFLNNTQKLGLQAAQTMDRKARNSLYLAYLSGEAMVTVAALAGATQLRVSTLNGFTQQLLNGRLANVTPANPLPITFSTAEPANQVIGFAEDDPSVPFGNGTLTLANPLAGAVAVRVGVFASTRARRFRVGAGATVDALTAANVLTLDDVIGAVTRLRENNVPPHPDGYYHVHLTPRGEQELFADNHWQRLHQSLPDSIAYRDLAVGAMVGCVFYRNTENPRTQTVISSSIIADPGGGGLATLAPEIGGELTNEAGVEINRAIVTGGGAQYEKYLDESKFITEAGVMGKIGAFSIINGGVSVMAQRVRYILRAPQDGLQQIVSQFWSWSGDFPIPSDQLTGDGARFKRAVVIEHA